jgi:hypothetical protein
MSDPRTKALRGATKDVKQGKYPEDELRIPNRKKKRGAKPYKVYSELFNRAYIAYDAPTEEQAKEWIAKQMRSCSYAKVSRYTIVYEE